MLRRNVEENEKSLIQKNSTIENLRNELKKYENAEGKHDFSTATSLASTKIVELSRKLREKNAEVESWKTKCSKLERKVIEMQDIQAEQQMTKGIYLLINYIFYYFWLIFLGEDIYPQKKENDGQLKKLQEKLNTTSMKMRELQNTNIHLKNGLKMANKYLQQEVGDTFDTISNNNNFGWRGRAQIICDLQQKNVELKEKLKNYQNKSEYLQIC